VRKQVISEAEELILVSKWCQAVKEEGFLVQQQIDDLQQTLSDLSSSILPLSS
jgi:hypothetical protein